MRLNEILRLLAGIMVLLGTWLSVKVEKGFIWLLVFVGVNLVQSAFTKWCPAIWILRKIGIKD